MRRFLEMVQSLHTETTFLKKEFGNLKKDMTSFNGRFSTLEKETDDLAHKTQSMTVGAETLFERICTVESINWSVKGYDRLNDRMSIRKVISML